MGQFRVGIPNSTKSVFLLDSNEGDRFFTTTLGIIPKNKSVPKKMTYSDVKDFDYKWITDDMNVTHPESTVFHPTNFIAKLSTNEFIQQCFRRKYYHMSSLYHNSFHMSAGLLPQVITTLTLRRIQQRLVEGGVELVQAVITVPKFWVQAQREAIYYPAKRLKMTPLIIDSTMAIASYLAVKYKRYLNEHPHRVLTIDIGATSSQAMIFEFGRIDKLHAHEVVYSWSDKVGGRDFDTIIADLIQKQTKTTFDPVVEVARIREAEKVKKLLDYNEKVDGAFEGVSYTITRKVVESASQDHLNILYNMINQLSNVIPLVEVDMVEIIGGGSKFFAIQKMLNNIFGSNRLSMSENPEEVIAMGAAWLASQQVNVDSLPSYPIEISKGNDRRPFTGTIPFKSGPVFLSIRKDQITPIGVPGIVVWGNVTENTTIHLNPSQLIKMKQPLNKISSPWLAETMKLSQVIGNRLSFIEKLQIAHRYLRYELGNYSNDLADSELLDEVITLPEREEITNALEGIKLWYEANHENATLEEVISCEDKVRIIMAHAIMKKENCLFLESSIEKMKMKIIKIHENIKNFGEIYSGNLTNELVKEILTPIVETTLWFEDRILKQKTKTPSHAPSIWWFDIESKITELEEKYSEIFSKITNSGKK